MTGFAIVERRIMTPEEIKNSVLLLRERRESIPAMRDYKPQKGGKKAAQPVNDKPPEDTFGDLFSE